MKDYSKMTLNDLAKAQAKLFYENSCIESARREKYDQLEDITSEICKRMGHPFTPKEFAEALIAEKESLIN